MKSMPKLELLPPLPPHEREPSRRVEAVSLGGDLILLKFPIGTPLQDVMNILNAMAQVFTGTYTITLPDGDPRVYTKLEIARNRRKITYCYKPDRPDIVTVGMIKDLLPDIIDTLIN